MGQRTIGARWQGGRAPGRAPPAFPLHPDGECALAAIEAGLPLALVLGGAGTGKTTFLQHLQASPGRAQVFLAPTGVAALALGGQTVHSFFGLPPRLLNADDVKPRARQKRLLRRLERLVIDEISMVRADLLDAVDRMLRLARDRDAPFGGVQTILVGDFLQLPPVAPQAEQEMLQRLGYETPFAFDARALEREVARIAFRRVLRQTEDDFVALLARLRRGDGVADAIASLNETCLRPHRHGRMPILLAPTNARVEAYNRRGLAALSGPERVFRGAFSGEFDLASDRLPVPENLVLKPGARVMAVRNAPGRQWVNGSLGTVLSLDSGSAAVRLDSGDEVEITPATWEKIRYEWDEAAARVDAVTVGTYTQLPLVPAWAITIHKAQGLTLDDLRIDMDLGAFAPGQAYVALSRARSRDGLSLTRPLRASDVRVDRRVAAFVRDFERATEPGADPL